MCFPRFLIFVFLLQIGSRPDQDVGARDDKCGRSLQGCESYSHLVERGWCVATGVATGVCRFLLCMLTLLTPNR